MMNVRFFTSSEWAGFGPGEGFIRYLNLGVKQEPLHIVPIVSILIRLNYRLLSVGVVSLPFFSM